MFGFSDLDVALVEVIVSLTDLKSAASLSLTSKKLHTAVTPVLHSLCRFEDLTLCLPHEHDKVVPLASIWWGLGLLGGEYGYSQLVVGTMKHSMLVVTYVRPEDEFDLPFDRHGDFTHGTTRVVSEIGHEISGEFKVSGLEQCVVNTIVREASTAFTNKRAQHAAENYLIEHPACTATREVIAKDVRYQSMLDTLDCWTDIKRYLPRRKAQARLNRTLQRLDLRSAHPWKGFFEGLAESASDLIVVGTTVTEALEYAEGYEKRVPEAIARHIFSAE